MKRDTLTYSVVMPDGERRTATVRGQTAKALRTLVTAGPNGATALECGAWAFRFAAYCHVLRRRHGLTIETRREEHPGGWHGRHVLRTPIIFEPSESEVA
ncbi:MAG: hypothetical protein HZC25_08405 [Rhodospirillales bacterium]|nr:hypothetical protein [Rhodospirillales bacterium]